MDDQEANAGGRKATGKAGQMAGPPSAVSHNRPDTGPLPGPARALTWAGEPLRRERAQMPELTGKLDTSVNGPEGLPPFDGAAWDYTTVPLSRNVVEWLR